MLPTKPHLPKAFQASKQCLKLSARYSKYDFMGLVNIQTIIFGHKNLGVGIHKNLGVGIIESSLSLKGEGSLP